MLTKTVDDRILARYTQIWDPAFLWVELCRAYAGNTITRRSILKRRLFGLKFSESATMSVNFSIINKLLNDLAAVDVTFTDASVSIQLVNLTVVDKSKSTLCLQVVLRKAIFTNKEMGMCNQFMNLPRAGSNACCKAYGLENARNTLGWHERCWC